MITNPQWLLQPTYRRWAINTNCSNVHYLIMQSAECVFGVKRYNDVYVYDWTQIDQTLSLG